MGSASHHRHDHGPGHGHAGHEHDGERDPGAHPENEKAPARDPGARPDQGHDHEHHHHDMRATPMRRLASALAMTASFMFVEAFVGWWAKSLALVADAGHMLADAAALGLAILAQRIAAGERTRARTYGHRRAEVIAAFANGIALGLTAIWIFIESAQRWRNPPDIMGGPVAITAVIGLGVNIVSAVLLGHGGHGQNVNTRGAFAHVITDAIGSVGAILAGVLVLTFGWNRADPVISAMIGVLVLWSGWRLVSETTHVLMEGSPIEIDLAHIEKTLRGVAGVADFHDLHVWSISDGFDVLTVHIVLESGYHGTDVVAAVSKRLLERHKLDHCTIQPEPPRGEQLVSLRLSAGGRDERAPA